MWRALLFGPMYHKLFLFEQPIPAGLKQLHPGHLKNNQEE
jgi:hypothetical protein